MKYTVQLFRFLVGILFIFSGTIKAIDVIGTSYKLKEYFSVAVFNIPFLEENSLVIAIIFILLEIILGVLLLIGYKRKFTLTALLLLIIFFTFLTFYSAYFNVVKDCGCFGDFIALKPWESFTKDIILLVMIIVLVLGWKYINRLFTNKISLIILGLTLLVSSFIVWHGINRLPLVDFRPFAVGENIKDGLYYEEEQKLQIYRLNNLKNKKDTLVNSKDYIDSGIWKDTLNWVFDATFKAKDSIIKPATKPKIKHFAIADNKENIIEEEVLSNPKLVLIIFPDDSNYCTIGEDNIRQLIQAIKKENTSVEFLAIGSSINVMNNIPSATLDDTIMKQMIRSNPGILVLSKGKVLGKYHYKKLPTAQQLINLFKI